MNELEEYLREMYDIRASGGSLTVDEARYVTETERRLEALMLLGSQLDENYRAVMKAAYKW
jgi:hypothetical protein